jgi:ribonuclease HII
MLSFYKPDKLECGVDEAGRGPLIGSVYTGAVILPHDIDPSESCSILSIKDSKKLSSRRRKIVQDYIYENAIDHAIGYADHTEIDTINIRKATYTAMHRAISNLKVLPELLLIDGDDFDPYFHPEFGYIPEECMIGGDATYVSIAAASILAKEAHDKHINDLCDKYPDLEKYGLRSNMGYGTKTHLAAIKEHGISEFHRKTFGICKQYCENE